MKLFLPANLWNVLLKEANAKHMPVARLIMIKLMEIYNIEE